LRAADGTISTFARKNSTATVPFSVSDVGTITGFYIDLRGIGHGFVRHPDGTFATFGSPSINFVFAFSINSAGKITGYYQASVYTTAHGFLLSPSGPGSTGRGFMDLG
jgi:hypothetical protein